MRAESPMRSQPRVKRSDTLGSKNRFSNALCKSKSTWQLFCLFKALDGSTAYTKPRVPFRSTPLCPGLWACWAFSPLPLAQKKSPVRKIFFANWRNKKPLSKHFPHPIDGSDEGVNLLLGVVEREGGTDGTFNA